MTMIREAGAVDGSGGDADLTGRVRHGRRIGLWDLVQLAAPWVLLLIPTMAYIAWLPQPVGPETGATLGLVAVSALWVLFGNTLPLRRGSLAPAQAAVYFVGLLALSVTLMALNETFIAFVITGFFHAYLLRPWQVGLVGVFATSIAINTWAMRIWDAPGIQSISMFALIVVVQTAAVGAGILLTTRAEVEDRRREDLIARLEAALHENAGLHAQLVRQARESGAQDERQRLAHEIHDTLAQGLAGIITQLQAARRPGLGPGPVDMHVGRALEQARSSLSEARRSLRALAPQELRRARLPEALEALTERWAEESGVDGSLEVTGEQLPLSPAIEVALFRVAQESLTNVARHASARRARVTLSYTGPEVLLDVRDDGVGFSATERTGFGLTSMRQRIRGVGGQIEVDSVAGEGTSVSATAPAIAPGTDGDDLFLEWETKQ